MIQQCFKSPVGVGGYQGANFFAVITPESGHQLIGFVGPCLKQGFEGYDALVYRLLIAALVSAFSYFALYGNQAGDITSGFGGKHGVSLLRL
jgi:hypothetical protein